VKSATISSFPINFAQEALTNTSAGVRLGVIGLSVWMQPGSLRL